MYNRISSLSFSIFEISKYQSAKSFQVKSAKASPAAENSKFSIACPTFKTVISN